MRCVSAGQQQQQQQEEEEDRGRGKLGKMTMGTCRSRCPRAQSMRLTPVLLGLVLLPLLAWAPEVDARVEKSEIKNDDRTLVPVTAAFGFQPHGVIHVTVRCHHGIHTSFPETYKSSCMYHTHTHTHEHTHMHT